MPASFRKDLILKMDGRNPGALILSHRSDDIQRVSVTRIRVRDDGNLPGFHDGSRIGHHFGQRNQPQIGLSDS